MGLPYPQVNGDPWEWDSKWQLPGEQRRRGETAPPLSSLSGTFQAMMLGRGGGLVVDDHVTNHPYSYATSSPIKEERSWG